MSKETTNPEGIPIQQGLPATTKELVAKALALGVKRGKKSNFGFRSVGHSSPVPVVAEGAPIVDAAEGLRARGRGEIAITGHGVVTQAGKNFLAKAEATRLSDSADA